MGGGYCSFRGCFCDRSSPPHSLASPRLGGYTAESPRRAYSPTCPPKLEERRRKPVRRRRALSSVGQSASLTRTRSEVRALQRPPRFWPLSGKLLGEFAFMVESLFVTLLSASDPDLHEMSEVGASVGASEAAGPSVPVALACSDSPQPCSGRSGRDTTACGHVRYRRIGEFFRDALALPIRDGHLAACCTGKLTIALRPA